MTTSCFRGCCDFGLRLFRLRRLLSGCHLWLGGCLSDWLWDGFRSTGLDNSPPSDHVAPSLAQVHLLSRGSCLVRFWGSSRFACCVHPVALCRRPLCKRGPRLFAFHTSTVVRRVVALTAAAPRLSPRGRAATREVRAPTRDTPRSVSAVPLRMAEALAALALEWALWRHVRLHHDPQSAELGERAHCGHLQTSCHRHNEVGGGRTVLDRILVAAGGAGVPEHSCPGTPAPPGRRSQAFLYTDSSPTAARNGPPEARRCENSHLFFCQGAAARRPWL